MFPHPTVATSNPANMFKRRSGSRSPTKPPVAPTPTVEEDYKAKRIATAAKFDSVLLWTSLYEGKAAQLEDLAKATLRAGERPNKELEDHVVHFKDMIAKAQEEFHIAANEMEAWTLDKHNAFGKDIMARIEAHLDESREKLRTLKYSDFLPVVD
jgi:hypothetical protein